MERIAYQFNFIRPVIPTYLHLIVSALLPIYAGAHASLSRPSSAAKPHKCENHVDDDGEDDDTQESQQKMEGLSPGDAIVFPVIAGCTLAGLYIIIKWLEDPVLLNKILNWYFSVFGVLSVAKLFTDAMGVLHSYAFPESYRWDGNVWEVRSRLRKAESLPDRSLQTSTPLPGLLSRLPLPASLSTVLWNLRDLPSRKLDIRVYIHRINSSHFHIGPQGFLSLIVALVAVFCYNLFGKPWWLTNLMGFGFAYNVLQLMSPTTFWTGTLILSSLFFYDIYFVFFTPIMVTVATKLEIPAKLLFPRPSGPDEDPTKQALSMLGLGDVVLPGIMIGLALRYDLYLFYLRKQKRKIVVEEINKSKEIDKDSSSTSEIVKVTWQPATGGWGERFWLGRGGSGTDTHHNSGSFPKTYFHASLVGYVLGMLCTLSIMHIYGHAQPALLYLVPGVLGSLWGTAFLKGDIKTMWEFSEAENEELVEGDKGKENGKGKGIESFFSPSRQEKLAKRLEGKVKDNKEDAKAIEGKSKEAGQTSKKSPFERNRTNELIFFSITLPPASHEENKPGSAKAPLDQAASSLEEQNSNSNSNSSSLENELRRAFQSTLNGKSETGGQGLRRRGVGDEQRS